MDMKEAVDYQRLPFIMPLWTKRLFISIPDCCLGLAAGQVISREQQIATQSWRGVSTAGDGHTHVEVRNGWAQNAHYSVGDPNLENDDPYPFWEVVLGTAASPHVPYGALDGAEGGVGTIRVYGWAKDDDSPDEALTIHVYIDGPAHLCRRDQCGRGKS